MVAYGLTPLTPLMVATGTKAVGNGEYVIVLASGLNLICNPNADGSFSSFGESPNEGASERCTIEGNIVTFKPLGQALSFFFVGKLPNG